jgi:stearoyl-CoA desaturase (delta-9 desaturase)
MNRAISHLKSLWAHAHPDSKRLQFIYLIGLGLIPFTILYAPFREWLGFGWWFLMWIYVIQYFAIKFDTVVYHRLFAHNLYTVKPWFERVLVLISPLLLQSYPAGYSWLHLRHHKYADQEGDPHPPVSKNRRRWNNLLFPFLTEPGPVEYKLVLPLMKRPLQTWIMKYYWPVTILYIVLIGLISYKFLFIWLMGTQLATFGGARFNTYAHQNDKMAMDDMHIKNPQVHSAVNLKNSWTVLLGGSGEKYHYMHHTYPRRWNLHPESDQGKLDQNAWIIDKLVRIGIAEVKTPI